MAGRAKGFATWNIQDRTMPLFMDIQAVLEEYRAYLPLTVRQVFYRLVGRGYPKSESFYDSVQDKCNRARRSGRIPFSAIRDDGVSRLGGESLTYDSPEEFYADHEELSNYHRRSWHADQPAYVAVLCEAAGMVPMLERAVRRYRVPVASSSGFDSLTVKHDLFKAALEAYLQNRAQEWADTTGSTPPISVVERWQQQYMDEQELVRQAEREARLAEAEREYDRW
jgi:hypothetical protein